MQDPQRPPLEVGQPAEGVGDAAEAVGVDARGHRVDGEVAPEQVLPQRRGLDGRKRAGPLVVLGTTAGDVDVEVARQNDHRGSEAAVHLHAAAQLRGRGLGERDAVALDDDVDIEIAHAEQHVSHEAAHEVRALASLHGQPAQHVHGLLGERRQQRLEAAEERLGGGRVRPGEPAVEVRVAVLGAKHVLAGHHADDEPVFEHGHPADAARRKQALEFA